MTGERPEPKYHVGDIVTITEFTDCPFGWDDWGMDDYVDERTTIRDIFWDEHYKTYGYYVDADDGEYVWCENCFEFPGINEEIEESDADISVLFQ